MYDPEGPSPEDIERFSDDTGYCPSCGAEVWDMAPYCPACRKPMPDGAQRQTPIESQFQRKLMVLVVIGVIVAFLWFLL